MMSMPALSLHQPWAQLLVTRQPCDCPQTWLDGHRPGDHARTHPMAKWIETRSWPCPEKYRGQRMAFHATARRPRLDAHWLRIGDYGVRPRFDDEPVDWSDHGLWCFRGSGTWDRVSDLPRGAIVGSGIVTASVPIVEGYDLRYAAPHDLITVSRSRRLTLVRQHETPVDVSDQLPYGDFTPGRWAWIIEQAAPVQKRCPWCWGTGKSHGSCDACLDTRSKLVYAGPGLPDRRVPCPDCCTPDGEALPCPVCNGKTITDPIPARGHQRVWPWTPQQLEAA